MPEAGACTTCTMGTRTFTPAEVARHCTADDLWCVIGDTVYDLSAFKGEHPGGARILVRHAGTDVSKQFSQFHAPEVLRLHAGAYTVVGRLEGTGTDVSTTTRSVDTPANNGNTLFGNPTVPFAEPAWYTGAPSPYYGESHRRWRLKLRRFVDEHVTPFVPEWERAGAYPRSLARKAYAAGILGAMWPVEFGGTPVDTSADGGSAASGPDLFHDLIMMDELSRCGCGGVLSSMFFLPGIALPPVLLGANPQLKRRVAREVITGESVIALCITEPGCGSDVARLEATAVRRADGCYVLNGQKKYITGGVAASYYTVACRTGSGGMGGISLLLVERSFPGITVRRLKTQGWWCSNTAHILFDNVIVPASHLLGRENAAFKIVAQNFNHERFMIGCMCSRMARVCLEQAIAYARVRHTFAKRLADHQVIRHKIAEMARRVEATHAMLESLAYRMQHGEAVLSVAAALALLKVQATLTMEFCAREASQIFGGNGYLRDGPGAVVERIYREVRVNAIGGGSIEIMRDLAVRSSKL